MKSLLIGVAKLVAALVAISILFRLIGSFEQCPDHFTQAQIDEAGCIVGANIGAGAFAFYGIIVGIFLVLFALMHFTRRKNKH